MNEQKRWGATPFDWTTLSVLAGMTKDMLPVVSNPNASISVNSSLKKLGKVPSLYSRGERRVMGIGKWTRKTATGQDIDRWSLEPDYGICLQTRTVRAFDVDIQDIDTLRIIRSVFRKHGLASFPERGRADSDKFLLAFSMPGDFNYRNIYTAHGVIEFLANGHQFIAAGTHTDGARYEWKEGTPDYFPPLHTDTFDAVWAELLELVGIGETIEYRVAANVREARREVGVADIVADDLQEKGYVLSHTRDGRINIRCPFEGEHSGPSADDTATQYFPKGVGGFEQGHFKCLHAHCASRGDGDFINAIGTYADQFEVVELTEEQLAAEPPRFTRNDTGNITTTLANVVLALRSPDWLGVRIASDAFKDLIVMQGVAGGWQAFKDTDYVRMRLQLGAKGIKAVSSELIKDAVMLAADESSFDSAIDWLTKTVPAWDGIPRIDTYVQEVYKPAQKDWAYARSISRYMWSALAGRVLEPGCKVDMAPILCGAQGLGKSESIAAMVPHRELFVELDLSDKDDNMARLMRGVLVAELPELKGLRGREMDSIKAFITRRMEKWIPKFREFSATFPRRLLFIGTTNETEFLADDTGNRRWLPISVTTANTEYVINNRMQLWAEARELFRTSGIHYSEAETLAEQVHGDFKLLDPWAAAIREWVDTPEDEMGGLGKEPIQVFTLLEVMVGALRIAPKDINKGHEMRCGRAMHELGFTKERFTENGRRIIKWVRHV